MRTENTLIGILLAMGALVEVLCAGGPTSVARFKEISGLKVSQNEIEFVASGFLEVRLISNQAAENRVFGGPAQKTSLYFEGCLVRVIRYDSEEGVKGVPRGSNLSLLQELSDKNWRSNVAEARKIKKGDELAITFQGQKFVVNGFMVESIVGFGSLTLVEK